MMGTAFVVCAAVISQTPQPLPEIAKSLPATWPLPAWAPPESVPKAEPPKAEIKKGLVEVFPHVRVDKEAGLVEFDGSVCVDVKQAETPRVEIELFVCLPMRDKEMESLVVSAALGAHVHAGLLLAGLTPGEAGRIEFPPEENKIRRVSPRGEVVKVEFVWTAEGKERTASPLEWVIDERDGKRLSEKKDWKLVFGGSRFGKMKNAEGRPLEAYDADGLGTLIALCTYGSETIGLNQVWSHDSGIDRPWWVADTKAVPGYGTPVKVRVRKE